MADEDQEEGHGPMKYHVPMLFAVPDFTKDEVIITVGPLPVELFPAIADMLASEEVGDSVRQAIIEAREQHAADELAAKARMN